MSKNQLIIFIKNPVLGKVKTRLAESIGDENALRIYLSLLKHTYKITRDLSGIDKVVCYSDNIDEDDLWDNERFKKMAQVGSNLGSRMQNAFQKAFEDGAEKVVIIGSDCFELTQNYIDHAFNILKYKQAVVGPAVDGGYYLIGMNRFHSVFEGIDWGTHSVFVSTIKKLKEQDVLFQLLPVLYDVDKVEDIPESLQYCITINY